MRNGLLSDSVAVLMQKLRQIILENPNEAIKEIQVLEGSERFQEDPYFWCAVMIQKISVLTFFGEYDTIGAIIQSVYEKAKELGDYDILLEASVRLGSSYLYLGGIEQCIKLLNDVHEMEHKKGVLTHQSAIAYNNLASLYDEYDREELSEFCYEKAYAILEEADVEKFGSDETVLYISVVSNLASVASKKNDLSKFLIYAEKLRQLSEHKMPNFIVYVYKWLDYIDNNLMGRYDAALDKLMELVDLLFEDQKHVEISEYLVDFYAMSQKKTSHDEAFFIEKLDQYLDRLGDKGIERDVRDLYLKILKFSIQNDKTDLMIKYYTKVSDLIRKNEEQIVFESSQSLDFLVEIAEKKEKHERIIKENKSLNKLTEESLAKSVKLKRLYDKSRIITRLGQKITAKSSLSSIEKSLHNELSGLIPFDFMGLYVKKEKHRFVSPFVFENGKVRHEQELFFDDGVHVYAKELGGDECYLSSLEYPIKYKSDLLAFFSLKSMEEDAYKDHHLDLLDAITPYLAIAIVNWNRSAILNEKNELLERDKKKLRSLVKYHKALSSMDQLTKVSNRRDFDVRFKSLLKRAKKRQVPLHLMMFDIDNFKLYNDRNGHVKGDEALVSVSKVVHSVIRGKNTVFARYGGEEFVMVKLGDTHNAVFEIGKRILKGIEELKIKYNDGTDRNLSISMGLISVDREDLMDENELIKLADDCLYEAKRTGKNRIVGRVISEADRGKNE